MKMKGIILFTNNEYLLKGNYFFKSNYAQKSQTYDV